MSVKNILFDISFYISMISFVVAFIAAMDLWKFQRKNFHKDINGFLSGEGFDFYYTEEEKKKYKKTRLKLWISMLGIITGFSIMFSINL